MACPGCGLPVQIGYPRCPKCHTIMPIARSRRVTFREEVLSGGTTTAPPDGGTKLGWVVAGVLLAVGVGLAIFFALRGGAPSDSAAEPDTHESRSGLTGAEAPTAAELNAEREAELRARQAAPVEGAQQRNGAAVEMMKRVDEALRADRLWAKVRAEQTVLVIESSLCTDPGVMRVISDAAEALRAAGFASFRCQEPNGRIDLESGL